MSGTIKFFYDELRRLTGKIIITDYLGRNLDFGHGFDKAIKLIISCYKSKNKLIFIGNGASAAISSHMASDFWKNAKIKAMAFNDASLLTCVSNDFGYKYVFEKPIDMFAESGDILVAISSSGKSENILRGAKIARLKGVTVITLSGFSKGNPLRRLGGINFYVPSNNYGHVEIVHHSICHCLLDIIIQNRTILLRGRG